MPKADGQGQGGEQRLPGTGFNQTKPALLCKSNRGSEWFTPGERSSQGRLEAWAFSGARSAAEHTREAAPTALWLFTGPNLAWAHKSLKGMEAMTSCPFSPESWPSPVRQGPPEDRGALATFLPGHIRASKELCPHLCVALEALRALFELLVCAQPECHACPSSWKLPPPSSIKARPLVLRGGDAPGSLGSEVLAHFSTEAHATNTRLTPALRPQRLCPSPLILLHGCRPFLFFSPMRLKCSSDQQMRGSPK